MAIIDIILAKKFAHFQTNELLSLLRNGSISVGLLLLKMTQWLTGESYRKLLVYKSDI